MELVYSDMPLDTLKLEGLKWPKSVMLCGPTPRSSDVKSWRPDAIQLFEKAGFDGTLLIPEHKNGEIVDYDNQIEWEHTCLVYAACVMFWVPRNLENMIALTTNIEFGMCCGLFYDFSTIVYGRPVDAPKCRYLDALWRKRSPNWGPAETLEETVKAVIGCFKGERRFANLVDPGMNVNVTL